MVALLGRYTVRVLICLSVGFTGNRCTLKTHTNVLITDHLCVYACRQYLCEAEAIARGAFLADMLCNPCTFFLGFLVRVVLPHHYTCGVMRKVPTTIHHTESPMLSRELQVGTFFLPCFVFVLSVFYFASRGPARGLSCYVS